jgi:hypothetical protein
MPPNNPLSIAKESMQMSKESGDRTFKIVALVMMAATGLTALLQAGHMLWRDLRNERRHARGNGRCYPPEDLLEHVASDRAEIPSRQEDSAPERRWSGKAELARRTPDGSRFTAGNDSPAHGRQR